MAQIISRDNPHDKDHRLRLGHVEQWHLEGPTSGRMAVKAFNHPGDKVMKVFRLYEIWYGDGQE